jgi:hypothetical protein
MITLGSGTPLMEVFCFRRVWESVGAELFDAFTAVAFLVCRCCGVSLDELAGVDEEAWRPPYHRRHRAELRRLGMT